ncbi:uncharacterized protein LOC141857300 [Brevipalpus obovatus]|uniref:uncharacterized protein LOC141857300 n=1 Tax=Brevipalpus obovatus TaxID=246614 RepID=UPI003D9E2036
MSEKNMEWMYKGISGIVDREDYLTGRKVDKTFVILEKEENGIDLNANDEGCLPSALFASGEGTSGLKGGEETDVDYMNKLREDPLYEMKRKQIEAARKILDNPLRLKKMKSLIESTLKASDDSDSDSSSNKRKKRKKKKSHRKEEKYSSHGHRQHKDDKYEKSERSGRSKRSEKSDRNERKDRSEKHKHKRRRDSSSEDSRSRRKKSHRVE